MMIYVHSSNRKLKTWVYLLLDASLSPFGQILNPSQSKLSDVHQPIISNEIQDMSALKRVSMRLASAWEESWSPFGHIT